MGRSQIYYDITGDTSMTDINYPTASNAVISLVPNHNGFNIEDGKIVVWQTADEKTEAIQPTQAEIDAELVKLQKAYDDLAYSRARQAEYPDMGSQLNKIYDDGVTKWKSEMVDPVKAKWPKDNSGPV